MMPIVSAPVVKMLLVSFGTRSIRFFRCFFLSLVCVGLEFFPLPAYSDDGGFDYYVLALSWSPAYCATQKTQRSARQCTSVPAYGFVVHGLWPQYERGGFPVRCRENIWVPEEVIDRMLPLMPDKGLILHQWKKHGSCTGVSPDLYFAHIARLFKNLSLDGFDPKQSLSAEQVWKRFVQDNPSFSQETIRLVCRNGNFTELRLCLTRDTLAPRPCPPSLAQGCGS